MTAFAICRIKKLKAAQLGGAHSHNRRTAPTPNAGPTGRHRTLIGDGETIPDQVADRIRSAGVTRIRKDAVHAVEIVMSASPEYFRPGREFAHGEFDSDKTKAWLKATQNYLKTKFGENLVSLDLHLDEATPHVHAMVTPIIETQRKVRGKDEYRTSMSLSAKSMFDRAALQQLQSEYAAALGPLEIQRGIKGSRAKHETLKQFYGALDADNGIEPLPQPSRLSVDQAKDPARLVAWAKEQIELFRRKAEEARELANAASAQAAAYAKKYAAERTRIAGILAEYVHRDELKAAERRHAEETSELRESLKTAQERSEGLAFELRALELEQRGFDTDPKKRGPEGPSM